MDNRMSDSCLKEYYIKALFNGNNIKMPLDEMLVKMILCN